MPKILPMRAPKPAPTAPAPSPGGNGHAPAPTPRNGKAAAKGKAKPKAPKRPAEPTPPPSGDALPLKEPVGVPTGDEVALISRDLQHLQRQRVVVMKSRIMQHNRLVAVVAGTIGYSNELTETQRQAKFREAGELIDTVVTGKAEHPFKDVITTTMIGIGAFREMELSLEESMRKAAAKLPVAAWLEREAQKGFALLGLAKIVGEAGDLRKYAGPAKLWKRFGCAPWTAEGKLVAGETTPALRTLMGSTWRSGKEGKLSGEEWEAYRYQPRRRSIVYVIGVGMRNQNAPGPYRRRYDEAKAAIRAKHPDYSDGRCDAHSMLLATKLLLKNLWVVWNFGTDTKAGKQ